MHHWSGQALSRCAEKGLINDLAGRAQQARTVALKTERTTKHRLRVDHLPSVSCLLPLCLMSASAACHPHPMCQSMRTHSLIYGHSA